MANFIDTNIDTALIYRYIFHYGVFSSSPGSERLAKNGDKLIVRSVKKRKRERYILLLEFYDR